MVTESGFYKVCRIQSNPEVARYDAELDEWYFVGEIEPVKVHPLKVGDRVDVDTYDSLAAPVVVSSRKVTSTDVQSGVSRTVGSYVKHVDVNVENGVYVMYGVEGWTAVYTAPDHHYKVTIDEDCTVSFQGVSFK